MLKLLLGDPNARKLQRYQPLVSDINLLEEEVAALSDEELRALTVEFRQKLEPAAGNPQRQRQLLDELLLVVGVGQAELRHLADEVVRRNLGDDSEVFERRPPRFEVALEVGLSELADLHVGVTERHHPRRRSLRLLVFGV